MIIEVDTRNLSENEIFKLVTSGLIFRNQHVHNTYYTENLDCHDIAMILNKNIIINYNHNTHVYSMSFDI